MAVGRVKSATSFELVDDSDSDDEEGFRSIKATLTSEEYDADTIKAEFKSYQKLLPKPDKLLQKHHSPEMLRELIKARHIEVPRFLRERDEDGIKPHYALCCLLLDDLKNNTKDMSKESCLNAFGSWLVWLLSLGTLYRQRNLPAEIIRDQFYRVAHVIPSELVRPRELRGCIRHNGLPVPNYFLDPEDDKQFPPHIAMLVILQEGEEESKHLGGLFYRIVWFSLAVLALVLRLVLEVIGGAGAIWGGTEVFWVRNGGNATPCRWASIVVGIFCLFRFIVLNTPQNEDEGDILGPAGPWSLRSPARLRAVFDHPFHYFARARKPYTYDPNKPNLHSVD